MRSLRSSIAGVMAIVAVVALDIAVGRAVFAANTELVIGGALPCVALQWAAFSLLRSHGRARAFWLGFAALGSIITASFVWAMLFPEVRGVTRNGAIFERPGSSLSPIWMGYGRLVGDRIGPMVFDFRADPDPFSAGLVAFRAIIWSAPQILIALIGGLITWRIFAVGGARSRDGSMGERPSNEAMQRTRCAGR